MNRKVRKGRYKVPSEGLDYFYYLAAYFLPQEIKAQANWGCCCFQAPMKLCPCMFIAARKQTHRGVPCLPLEQGPQSRRRLAMPLPARGQWTCLLQHSQSCLCFPFQVEMALGSTDSWERSLCLYKRMKSRVPKNAGWQKSAQRLLSKCFLSLLVTIKGRLQEGLWSLQKEKAAATTPEHVPQHLSHLDYRQMPQQSCSEAGTGSRCAAQPARDSSNSQLTARLWLP